MGCILKSLGSQKRGVAKSFPGGIERTNKPLHDTAQKQYWEGESSLTNIM